MDTINTAGRGHRAAADNRRVHWRHRVIPARVAVFAACRGCGYECAAETLLHGRCVTCRAHRVEIITGKSTLYPDRGPPGGVVR